MKLFGFEIRRVPKVSPKAANEVWVTASGDRIAIGEMHESHAKHSLAMIVRKVRAGLPVKMLSNGQIFFGDDEAVARREERMRELDIDIDRADVDFIGAGLFEPEWP